MTTSASDGTFRIALPGGRYRIGAWLPDRSPLSPDYWSATWYGGVYAIGLGKDVVVTGDLTGVDLAFIRSPVISGRVVGPDGNGIAGAAVGASTTIGVQYGLGNAVSDPTGAFSFRTVPMQMTVIASIQGRTKPVWATIDLDVRSDVTGLRFVLPRGNLITGTLRDASGRPLTNTNFGADTGQVCCGGNVDTDPQGRFTIVLPDAVTSFHTWPRTTEPMLYSKEYAISGDATIDIVVTPNP